MILRKASFFVDFVFLYYLSLFLVSKISFVFEAYDENCDVECKSDKN